MDLQFDNTTLKRKTPIKRNHKFFGRDEYEYAVSLDAGNTKKLFRLLECDSLSDSEKLKVIKSRFENSRADSALREYCDKEGIKTSFWSWP